MTKAQLCRHMVRHFEARAGAGVGGRLTRHDAREFLEELERLCVRELADVGHFSIPKVATPRLELIDGTLHAMTPDGTAHTTAVHLVADALRGLVAGIGCHDAPPGRDGRNAGVPVGVGRRRCSAAVSRTDEWRGTKVGVHVSAVATLWEDLLARSSLPPWVGGVPDGEYQLARLTKAGPVRTVEASPAETWIWSDLHLRPGALADRMLGAWARLVAPEDLVICLGDVAHREAFEDEAFAARVRACPGRRLLVLGNHDLPWREELAGLGFADQVAWRSRRRIRRSH